MARTGNKGLIHSCGAGLPLPAQRGYQRRLLMSDLWLPVSPQPPRGCSAQAVVEHQSSLAGFSSFLFPLQHFASQ